MRREARTRPRRTPTRHLARGASSVLRVPRLLFALLALLVLAPAASAQTSVYHIRGNASAGSNNIWHINLTTGVETAVYTGYPGGNAATLAQRPSDGMLFYVINNTSGENGAVYRFNPATPSVAPVLLGNIGPSTSGGDVSSGFRMAFSPAGTLYYMSGGGGADNDRLYTVNQTTGRATPGGNITGTGNGGDMAFSTTGTLYIINQNRQLYTASTAGGAATLVGTITFPGGATPGTLGLGVDGSRLLIQTQNPSNMYAITLPSLAATLLDTLGGGTTSTGDLSTAIVPAPSLSVTKTDGVATTYQGASLTYTVVVTNNGTYTVTASVTDTIPAGLTGATWTCAASAGSSCAAASGSGNISTSATLEPGDTATYTISATVTASSGSIANTVTATPPAWLTDASPANNTATDTDTVVAAADLSITKTTASTFTVGSNASYTLTARNNGPQSAAGTITVTDILPAGLTYVSATGTGWTCSNSSGTVTCTRAGPVTSGTTLPAITLTVAVGAAAAPSVTNTATVASSTTFDPDSSGNSSSVTSAVTVPPDLTIAKSHTGNFTQGQTGATYTITVTNSGGSATSGLVTVTDTLPASLTSPVGSGTGWTCNTAGQTVTCTRSDALNGGASYPAITITVNVSATAPASVTNTASVSGGGQSNTANDTASDPTTINPVADMTVTKSHTGNFTRGSTGTYTITATNSGTAATVGVVTVTDTLPAGLTPSTATGTGWTCNIVTQTVTCTRSSVLNAGASYPAISITVSVAQSAASSVTNTATVSGGGQAVTSNDSASDPTTIVSSADLSLTKVTSNAGSGIGTNATFTITVTNNGPSDATGVAVRDQLPAGLTYVSSTPSVGTYNSGTGVWSVGNLASGVSATLQLVARVDSLGAITNTAQVSASNEPDPDSTPNNSVASEDDQASASLSTSPPNVSLCKTILGQPCPPPALPALPGSDLAYVITFTNTGGSSASNFVITDPIPTNTDFKLGSVTTSLGTTGLTVTVAYSNTGGATWVYVPVSGAGGAPAGYDRNVTHVRWSFGGSLSQTAPNNTGNVGFTVRIR